ncbi:dTDP-4-dehydrorhamnose reductase [plant metagenome]|uniref:dTDP-4-dehydrorhamnose reductase n=1 Tax=plant metagenome TaxID=1297885 RepID=A0A484SRH8_9ZZZZ
MKILVLGVTGMLGSAVFRQLRADSRYEVFGTMRTAAGLRHFSADSHANLQSNVDVLDTDALIRALGRVQPDVVVNCVGLIKQLEDAENPLAVLPLNAMLPHRLAHLCGLARARLIHISTDCVFSGDKGMYTEDDLSDAHDLYGKSKFIGEVSGAPHAVTLRTSIIGHELGSSNALVEWFLSQSGQAKGYTKAVFSGLPTAELARVIKDFVIPAPDLHGLYHVSVDPIDKYSLLKLVAEVYGKDIVLTPDDRVKIDRSLDSARFRARTGYQPPSWPELIRSMSAQR